MDIRSVNSDTLAYHARENMKAQGWKIFHNLALSDEQRARGVQMVIQAHKERAQECHKNPAPHNRVAAHDLLSAYEAHWCESMLRSDSAHMRRAAALYVLVKGVDLPDQGILKAGCTYSFR